MSDQSSDEHDEALSPESKLRVSFVLAPSVRDPSQREALALPTEPIAVPAALRKQGLSAVVNHLLGRRAPDDDSDDESDDDDKGAALPVVPFDFLLNDQLLRLPLDAAARKEGLSTERALELQYFPARLPPRRAGESEALPEWITAMAHCRGGAAGDGVLFAGGADGVLRAFAAARDGGALRQSSAVAAHTGPIKCLAASAVGGRTLVATGSTDQTLVTHACRAPGAAPELHAVYSGGHANSVGSVALSGGGENALLASGDWDGGLAVWSVPASGEAADDGAAAEAPGKKRKGSRSRDVRAAGAGVHEVRPLRAVKAHTSNLSGLAWGHRGGGSAPTTLLTGSWDHGLKVYDAARLDCLLTLNGARVVTALARCSNSDVVATAAPDCTVRLWDLRTDGGGGGSCGGDGGKMDKSLRQSHKAWVSSVEWSPTDPFALASTSHDGTLKVWDIRSSLPLHTVRAVDKKGEKALCLAFGDGILYSGGSDCVVKQFACKL